MPTWKKICLGLAFLVALGVAASAPATGAAGPAGAAPAGYGLVGAEFPPPTGG